MDMPSNYCPAFGPEVPRCSPTICDCFIEQFPDDPEQAVAVHPEFFAVEHSKPEAMALLDKHEPRESALSVPSETQVTEAQIREQIANELEAKTHCAEHVFDGWCAGCDTILNAIALVRGLPQPNDGYLSRDKWVVREVRAEAERIAAWITAEPQNDYRMTDMLALLADAIRRGDHRAAGLPVEGGE